MTVEFDGLTNGFSFRSMQFPLGAYDEWLPRVGVIDGDSEVGSMAEMKEDGMEDTYGRDIVQNDAYKNRMIEKGYAVPTFFDGENDMASVDAMNKAKEEKRGLWADPEYAREMAVS